MRVRSPQATPEGVVSPGWSGPEPPCPLVGPMSPRLAERQAGQLAADRTNWHKAGIAVTCRWLARAIVKPESGRWRREMAPITNRDASAYEELIEAECLAAEKLLWRRPVPLWVRNQPGWVEASF